MSVSYTHLDVYKRQLLLLSPGGRRFDQTMAAELAEAGRFSLLCGRYEGVDQRIADHLVDGEVSLGDFVLAGGELGALVIVEAVGRLVPGAVSYTHLDVYKRQAATSSLSTPPVDLPSTKR